jgi:opacity protein-like surface antigen
LNLRVEGLALGHGAADGAGMGGVGLSLRYRPVPAFAFDLGADILGGVDYNGFDRTETPVSLSGLLFVNPKSRVQFYLMGGVNYSHAKVKSKSASPLQATSSTPLLSKTGNFTDDGSPEFGATYSYVGGQGGAGLEFRLSRHMGLNVDALGFMRHRIDSGPNAEFSDPKTGQDTKSSGGGLFRGGLSFWW